jgi:hypothetical protein
LKNPVAFFLLPDGSARAAGSTGPAGCAAPLESGFMAAAVAAAGAAAAAACCSECSLAAVPFCAAAHANSG